MSMNTLRVPEIQYSSTASTSTEYEYPSPVWRNISLSLEELAQGLYSSGRSKNKTFLMPF